jgi:hypothetical protein
MSQPQGGPYADEQPDMTCIVTSNYQVHEEFNENTLSELTLLDPDFVPVSTISNADDTNHGVYTGASQLFHATAKKAEQVQLQNILAGNTGFTVNWDGKPATALDTLEDTGKSPTLWDDRIKESLFVGRDRKSFDPKAPHFDVILISLLDSPYFPKYEYEPEGGLPPTEMDDLPVESLLGRPGFVVIHVGGTAIGKLEGLRLFGVWGVRFLEVSHELHLPYPSHLRLTSVLNRAPSGSPRTWTSCTATSRVSPRSEWPRSSGSLA